MKFSNDVGETDARVDSHRFDRSYAYDFMGRLTAAKSGAEARGQTSGIDRNVTPYKHDYTFNAFGNVTSRQTFTWTEADDQTSAWTNGRESTWLYDADGRLKHTEANNYDYNVSGAVVAVALAERRTTYQMPDGEGRTVRRDFYRQHPINGRNQLEKVEYAIYSSALGQLLTELNADGTKKRTFVYGAGGVIATQHGAAANSASLVLWQHHDAANASHLSTTRSGTAIYDGGEDGGQAELDPLGSNVGAANPNGAGNRMSSQSAGPGGWGSWGDPFGGYSCMVDWVSQPCSFAAQVLGAGAGSIGPLDQIAAWQQWRRPDGTTFWRAALWERGANGLGYWSVGRSFTGELGNEAWDGGYVRKWNAFGDSRGGQPPIRHPERNVWSDEFSRQTRVDIAVGYASDYLDNNRKCEDFLNNFLLTLGSVTGSQPFGSIREILKEFRRLGDVTIDSTPPDNPKSSFSSNGETRGGNWSFYISTAHIVDRNGVLVEEANKRSNGLTVLHEIIHAINAAYGDDAYVLAGQRLGMIMSPEEFVKSYPNEVNRDPNNGEITEATRVLARNLLWHGCNGSMHSGIIQK